MRKLSHNYFPLTLGKGKPLYIRSIYTFSFPRRKSRYFPEFFFPKENLIFLDFFLKERKEIFSTFSLSVKFLKSNFPSDIFPLISYRLDPHQSKIRRVLSAVTLKPFFIYLYAYMCVMRVCFSL